VAARFLPCVDSLVDVLVARSAKNLGPRSWARAPRSAGARSWRTCPPRRSRRAAQIRRGHDDVDKQVQNPGEHRSLD